MYKDWAEGQINKMKGILNAAKEDHTSAVKKRIASVKQLGSVVEVTKQLFEVSKVMEHFDDMVTAPGCCVFAHLDIGNRQARGGSL